MSAEEDADIDALTSATAAANVSPTKTSEQPASSAPADTKSADVAAEASPAAAAAGGDAAPAKEEPRKIGKLNLAAFNAPAESTPEKAPAKTVGKLATNFVAATSADKNNDDKKDPPRAVGKLGVKLNIPIFAPGAAPPALAKDKGDASASPVDATDSSAAAAAAAETVSESPKPASPAPESAAAAADSASSAAAASSGPAPSPANKSQPGKLQANPLMANLNSILGGGPRKPAAAGSETEEKKEGGEAASSSSAAAASSSSSASSSSAGPQAEEPAAPITHAKRARVRRRSKTKPSQLQNSDIGAKFEEVKVDAAPVAAITVVSTEPAKSEEPKASPKGSPKHKTAASSASSIPLDSLSSSSVAASSSSSTQASEPQEDPEFAATAALLRQAELDAAKEKLLAATVPVPSVAEANPMDAKAKAALTAMYGEYEEAGFDEAKADEYRMLTAAGTSFLKHGKSGKPHERVVFVTANLVLYFMESSKRSKPDPKSSINLALATIPKIKVVKGKTTVNFKRSTAAKVDEDLCFSILGKERELDLQAKTKEERDAWFAALKYLLHLAQERREKALLESAMGSSY